MSLSVFHTKIEPIKKESDNPFFKSKYASLDTILEAIKEPLAQSDLSFAQFPDGQGGLTTILMHTMSNEWIEATYNVPLAKQDPQGAGSALSYMRRYALGAILGLATETDDDANHASDKGKRQAFEEHVAPKQASKAPISPAKAKINPTTGKPITNDVGLDF